MDVQAEFRRWVDLALDAVTQPSGVFPHQRLMTELSNSFDTAVSWNWQNADGSFRFDLSHPVSGWPTSADVETFAQIANTSHPLLWWYRTTMDLRPLTVDRVPKQLAPPGSFDRCREVCRPAGIERQLSIPYDFRPEGHRAFVLARSGQDFGDEDLALSRLIHPLIVMIARQCRTLEPGESAGENASELTGREHAVVRLLAEGRTAQGIAHVLGVSPRTVHTHLAHAYRKLGVSDRLRAVLVAEQLGLLGVDAESPGAVRPSQVVYEPALPETQVAARN